MAKMCGDWDGFRQVSGECDDGGVCVQTKGISGALEYYCHDPRLDGMSKGGTRGGNKHKFGSTLNKRIKIKESDLVNLIKKVINESQLLSEKACKASNNVKAQGGQNWVDCGGNRQTCKRAEYGWGMECAPMDKRIANPGGGPKRYYDDEIEVGQKGGCVKQMSCAEGYLWSEQYCDCISHVEYVLDRYKGVQY